MNPQSFYICCENAFWYKVEPLERLWNDHCRHKQQDKFRVHIFMNHNVYGGVLIKQAAIYSVSDSNIFSSGLQAVVKL